jgi:general secretion pathway protein A
MYCDFYQMTERPFTVTPDPKCLYLNARYREALAALHYGITQRKGFITLIGEAGTGKTTLLKRLLDDFDEKTRSVFIFNTHVTFEEILEYLFAEFDLPVHNGKKLYMLQRLNTFLLEELRGGGNVALLIDEAQDLDYSVLEDLRLLSNLETAKEKILQIVLSGQPELGDKLANPTLRQLRQRIAVSCRLLPLSRDEISEYIQYRLHAVGCSDLKLFSRDAEDQIYRFSHGIPRLINVVCDNALVIGYALGRKRIGGDIIGEAAADLMPLQEPVVEAPPAKELTSAVAIPMVAAAAQPRTRVGLVAVVLGAILIGLLSVGRSMLQRPASTEGAQTAPPAKVPEVARPADVIRPGSLLSSGSDAGEQPDPAARPVPVYRPKEVPPPAADAGGGESPEERVLATGSGPRAGAASKPVASAGNVFADELGELAVKPKVKPIVRAAAPAPAAPAPAAAQPSAPSVAAPSAVATVDTVHTTTARVTAPPPRDQPSRADSGPIRLATTRFERVTVQQGDSISRLALRKYGQANPTILDLLKLANPDLHDVNVISVGQTIQLPDLSESSVVAYGDGRYGVLVYSTTESGRAVALESALRARGHHALITRASLGQRHPIFRVILDGFPDRDSAASASKEVQRLFREDSRMALLVR